MTFRKKTLKRKYTARNTKRIYTKKKKVWSWWIFKFIIYLFVIFLIISSLSWLILYKKYIAGLPSVNELENLDIAEASTIYDKDGNELYKVFKEKRTYINYDQISSNMINWIIAWEDKTFFSNPWVDLKWIFRAIFNYVTWKTDRIKWTSTISQQLIRNTIIANERKIERKIKEVYLSYKMNKWLSKEKILELYLNKISYWSNAYWIEQASKTFFWKSAKNLWVLESSILASLPKWPTYYSPYNHPDRVLGYLYTFPDDNEEDITKIITSTELKENEIITNKVIEFIWLLKAKDFLILKL